MKLIEFYRPDGKKLNIEIIKYQPDDLSRNKTPDRHRHNFQSLFFILEGKSVQEINFQDYEIEANQIMLIPKGAIHWPKNQLQACKCPVYPEKSRQNNRICSFCFSFCLWLYSFVIENVPWGRL